MPGESVYAREARRERERAEYEKKRQARICQVYRIYVIETGELRYVGFTNDLRRRLREHQMFGVYKPDIHRVESDTPMPYALAAASERQQIRDLNPSYNLIR